MQIHVTVLGWLQIVFGALGIIAGILMLAFAGVAGSFAPELDRAMRSSPAASGAPAPSRPGHAPTGTMDGRGAHQVRAPSTAAAGNSGAARKPAGNDHDPAFDAMFSTNPLSMVSGVYGVVGGLVALASLLGLIGGFGLLRCAPWGRVLAVITSILSLPGVPFGTALGVYGLVILFNAETVALFDRRPAC
jgi:hypothetical protein